MGATTFATTATGETAQKAFAEAVTQARYDHGHGGYTGTIAEKNAFVMIAADPGPEPLDDRARRTARRMIDAGDSRIDDKWGPAGCIKLTGDRFLFFGWASE